MLYKLKERNSRNFAGGEVIGERELNNLFLDGRSMAQNRLFPWRKYD